MGAFSLRRFTKPETLRGISRDKLLELLGMHREYFLSRGVALPVPGSHEPFDVEALIPIFLSPDRAMPMDLVESLYLINELATPKGMDAILRETRSRGIRLPLPWQPTALDVAVCAFLADREILERIHHEHAMLKRRTFVYFKPLDAPRPLEVSAVQAALPALEAELNEYFAAHNRGRHVHVFLFPRDAELWLTIRHGDVFRREVNLEDEKSVMFVYRPECFNAVVYNGVGGELRVQASTDGERELYRHAMGKHLLGSEFHFWGAKKYSCDPLRTAGPACLAVSDVEGIEWARLTEIHCEQFVQRQRLVQSRKASDLFATCQDWRSWFPTDASILRANFKVKFRHAKAPQSVSLCPPHTATYSHDADCSLTERWLRARGFICADAAN